MTSTLAATAATRPRDASATGSDDGAALTAADLLALSCLLVLAVVGWVSLGLAHLGAHSGVAVLLLSAVLVTVVVTVARRGVRLRLDLAGLAVALGCAAVAAALTMPGFSYGVSDKDPGGYVSHALSISRTGDYALTDPVLATAAQDPTFPVQLTSPGARFSGVWVRDASTGRIVPQFFHLWPSLLATSYDLGGRTALLATVPLMGVVSVLALCALLRRVGEALLSRRGGLLAAGAGGLLLATNMLQVWQSRYPTTEVLAQALYVGALLGVVVALQVGWRPAAGLAGLLVGVGWLNRADGLLLVMLAVGLGAALLALRRWDGRAGWAAAGLAVVAPHAALQAYDLALNYSLANDVPSLRLVVGLVVGCVLAALLLRALPLERAVQVVLRRQVLVGALVVVSAGVLLTLGFLRPRLFGEAFLDYNGRVVRSYDEQILARLAWFVSLPGFALALAGVAVAALRRWRAVVWTVVLPTLLLLPLYGYTARNSTRLLWWTRRYVPTVLPGLVVLIALALAFFLVWRYRGRLLTAVPAAAALAGLLVFSLSQSVPLRGHDEWRGSFEVSARIAAVAGDERGTFLWEADQGCCAGPTRLFATPVWLQHGQLSALLPSDAGVAEGYDRAAFLDRYVERFGSGPVLVVADAGELPAGLDAGRLEQVLDLQTSLPMWEESDLERPDEAREVPVHVTVWRVRGT